MRTELGEPVIGQVIGFSSLSAGQTFRAVTNDKGEFHLPDAIIADDYQMLIRPNDDQLETLRRSHLQVGRDGLELAVEMRYAETWDVRGRILDTQSTPMAGYVIGIRGQYAARMNRYITSDEHGVFLAEDIPLGPLVFEISGNPNVRVEGYDLQPNTLRDADITIDKGPYRLTGRVVDRNGEPVGLARVRITWSSLQNGYEGGLSISTSRNSTASETGLFVFDQLSQGEYQIQAEADGYDQITVAQYVDAGIENISVELH